MKETIIN